MEDYEKEELRIFARQVATELSSDEMEQVAGGDVFSEYAGTCDPFGSQTLCFNPCSAFLD